VREKKGNRQNILPEVVMKVGKIRVLQKIADCYKLKMFNEGRAKFKIAAVINL